jgi:hypothetical protein
MFYLKILFRFIRYYPARNFIFYLMSMLLIASPFYKVELERKILVYLPQTVEGDSFHALISSDVNIARVGRKLRALPGVHQVISLGEKEVTGQVQQLMKRLEVSSSLLEGVDLNSAGLNIIFKKGVKDRVKNLIRDYLIKFVGPEKVTLGAIITRDKSLTWADTFRGYFERWGFSGIFIFLSLVWIVALSSWGKKMTQEIAIIQDYQRRKHISLKIYFISSIFFIGEIGGLLILNNFKVALLYLIVCIIMLFLGTLFSFPQVGRRLS